jgi:quinol monooxygenase YgiN
MITLLVCLTVKDAADVEKVERLLGEAGRLSRAEPGCSRFEVYHSNADAKFFVLCEHWESQAALDQHRLGKAYNEIYKPQVMPLIERVAHPSTMI